MSEEIAKLTNLQVLKYSANYKYGVPSEITLLTALTFLFPM